MKYYIANAILYLLPPTRFFYLKRVILRLLGLSIGRETKVCGAVKFYGAGRIVIGANTWVGIGCKFYTSQGGDVFVGSRCDIAPEVAFHCGSHEIGDLTRRAGTGTARSIHVGNGSWIGVRSTILAGTEIGESCIVGAASLVLGECFLSSSLILGVPARVIRKLEDPDLSKLSRDSLSGVTTCEDVADQ